MSRKMSYREYRLEDNVNKDKKAVLLQGNRAMPQLCFGLKFADIHYKCKSSQALKATGL